MPEPHIDFADDTEDDEVVQDKARGEDLREGERREDERRQGEKREDERRQGERREDERRQGEKATVKTVFGGASIALEEGKENDGGAYKYFLRPLFYLLWRGFTITTRLMSLILFATIYTYWVVLPLLLHWIIMITSLLIYNRRLASQDRASAGKLFLLSFIDILDVVDMWPGPKRYRYLVYYVLVYTESVVLVCLWYTGTTPTTDIPALDGWHNPQPWEDPEEAAVENRTLLLIISLTAFWLGILFLILYYTCGHPSRYSIRSRPVGGSSNPHPPHPLHPPHPPHPPHPAHLSHPLNPQHPPVSAVQHKPRHPVPNGVDKVVVPQTDRLLSSAPPPALGVENPALTSVANGRVTPAASVMTLSAYTEKDYYQLKMDVNPFYYAEPPRATDYSESAV